MIITYPLFRHCLVSFLMAVLAIPAAAQHPREAESAFEDGNYFEAMSMYSALVEKEPDNPEYNQNLGLSYLRTNVAPKKALDYLLRTEETGNFSEGLYLEIARAYMFNLQYEEALRYVNKFKENGGVNRKTEADYSRLRANCIAAQDLLKYPVDVKFQNLGENINSEYPDYYPFVTKDGKKLVYTSRRKVRPGSRPEFDGYYPSDIYLSYFEAGEWQIASRVNDRINSVYDEQSVGLTNSGDTLFYYIDHVEDFGDIFTATFQKSNYMNPTRMGNMVNSGFTESACTISDDGKTMLFSSNRKDGRGGLDLWTTEKQADGNWSEPKNLGSQINTPFDEDFPTLSSNGQTLFFCSEGLPGMGGFDFYFSVWDEQSKRWSKPQNLGYPLNSPNDEKTISYINDGRTAYTSAFRPDGFGDLDIYKISYQQAENDDPAVFVFSIPLKEGETAPEIEIRDQYDEPVGKYVANRVTGRYVIGLYPGKYFLYIDAPGYKPYTEALVVNRFHTRQSNNVKVIKLKK